MIDFSEIAFAFSIASCDKSECARLHPAVMFQIIKYINHKSTKLSISYELTIKFKIIPLKAQVLKSYRNFVIQKSCVGRAFLHSMRVLVKTE